MGIPKVYGRLVGQAHPQKIARSTVILVIQAMDSRSVDATDARLCEIQEAAL